MTDNGLIALFTSQIDAALANAGWTFNVIQKDQPTQQGQPSAGAVYFQKLFDHPYGSPMISKVSNYPVMTFTETESQWYETTFQVSALVTQDPTNLSLPTASDVANYVKMYIATRSARAVLMAQNVGMHRITEVRNPPFQDDRERYEYQPNFDVVLTHIRPIDIVVPGTNIVKGAAISGFSGEGIFPVPE